MRRAGDGGVGAGRVADGPQVALVVGRLGMQRAAGSGHLRGLGHVHHRGQLLVVHLHQCGGVLGLLQGSGHHQGHAVAHVAHLVQRQDGVLGLLHRRAVDAVDQPAAGQAAHVLEVLAGVDAQHAGRGLGRSGVHAREPGVGIRRADEDAVGLLRQRDVVGVLAATGEEARVFAARHRLADEALSCSHAVPLAVKRPCRQHPAARP